MSPSSYPAAGYPDYTKSIPKNGLEFTTVSGPLSGAPTSPVFSTTGYSFLLLTCNANSTTAAFWIEVDWLATSNPASKIASSTFTPDHNNNNAFKTPVLSSFCQIKHIYFSGPNTDAPVTTALGHTVDSSQSPLGSFGIHSLSGTTTVGAGLLVNVNAVGSGAGLMYCFIANANTGPYAVGIYYYNAPTNAYIKFNELDGTGTAGEAIGTISTPDAPVLIQFDNLYTASQTFTYSFFQP